MKGSMGEWKDGSMGEWEHGDIKETGSGGGGGGTVYVTVSEEEIDREQWGGHVGVQHALSTRTLPAPRRLPNQRSTERASMIRQRNTRYTAFTPIHSYTTHSIQCTHTPSLSYVQNMSHTESHIRIASVVLSFCGRVRKKETKLFTQIMVAWARRNVFPVPVSLYNESAAHCSTASKISLVNRHPVCVRASCVCVHRVCVCIVCVVCVSWREGMSGGVIVV